MTTLAMEQFDAMLPWKMQKVLTHALQSQAEVGSLECSSKINT